MGIKSCLNLLIVSVVLRQGIAVALEENKEVSSSLLLRQKRSTKAGAKASPEVSSSYSSAGVSGYLNPPRPGLDVGTYNPGRWEGRLPPGMVRIYRGTYELGIGVMTNAMIFVTKAHIFPQEIQPGEFHVEYSDQYGVPFSHDVTYVEANALYAEKRQNPWGPDDVCFAKIAESNRYLPVEKPVSTLLKKTRIFTLKQILWIGSRTGYNDRPGHYTI